MKKNLSQRLNQLIDESKVIEATYKIENNDFIGNHAVIDNEKVLTWKVKVKSLLTSVCGEDSQYFQEFVVAEELVSFDSNWDIFKRMKSVLNAFIEDYENGYLISLKNLIQADVFDNELEQALELLSNGYKLAAAVIAGVVLETALRDLCSDNSLDIGKLDKMNSDLAKSGVYNKLQQKRITALADIRNSAAHGKPEEFTEEDTKMMIRDIEQFLAVYLS